MSDLIRRQRLNGKSVEENLSIIETWMADTADKLNYMLSNSEGNNGKDSNNRDK